MTSEERARELLEAEIDKPEAPWVPQLGRVNTSQALRAIVRAIEEEREALRPLLDAIDRWEQDNAPETEQAIMDAAAAIRQRESNSSGVRREMGC